VVSDINRVNSSQTGGTQTNGTGAIDPGKDTAVQGQPSPANSGSEDVVQLSSQAADLQALESQLASQPTVDSARVQALKQAINQGDFQINPDRVAQKLIDADSAL
jgi:negative regulator of flagellin synthesis FlgM